MQILTEVAWYWYAIVALLAGFLAYFTYKNGKSNSVFKKKQRIVLTAIRGILLLLLGLLLLNPMVRQFTTTVEKPLVLLLNDNSKSLMLSGDTAWQSAQFKAKWEALGEALAKEYDVKMLSFDAQLNGNTSYQYNGNATALGTVLQQTEASYLNKNLSAVVVASDGIINQGPSVLTEAQKLNCPVYTVLLGDTVQKKDALIKTTLNNSIAYLGNQFPIKVNWEIFKGDLPATKVTLSEVDRNGKERILAIQKTPVTKNYATGIQSFLVQANETGIKHLRISIDRLNNELTYTNNTKDVFVEILENKQSVLLLAQAPHPDISALQQAISNLENTTLTVKWIDQGIPNLKPYSLVIAHQLPGNNSTLGLYTAINQENIPLWSIIGKQTNLNAFGNLQQHVAFNTKGGSSFNRVFPSVNEAFSAFTLSNEWSVKAQELPPIEAPYADYKLKSGTEVLLWQKIGNLNTPYPLLSFSSLNGTKNAIFWGEGLWRWRLGEFEDTKSHALTDELIRKTLQYLSTKTDKRLFKVSPEENRYNENDNILFKGELYNKNYEPVNVPDVQLKVTKINGPTRNFTMLRSDNIYRFEAGNLPSGKYEYEASTVYLGNSYIAKGAFVVNAIDLEGSKTTANAFLMQQLANQTAGKMVFKNEIGLLEDLLKKNETLKPIVYEDELVDNLIQYKYLLFLMLLLLAFEWFLRKWWGSY